MTADKPPDDLDATGIRKLSLEAAEDASAVYHSLDLLRNLLPASVQRMLAVSFEWARQGTAKELENTASPDLEALSSAYALARDEMLAAAKEND